MTIECPRCGERVEYTPGAVRTCSYCQVNLHAIEEKPALDWVKIREEYEKMGIEELRAAIGKLEKEYPPYRTEWLFEQTLLYPLWVAAGLVATVLGLLLIRVLCEFLCVVFNIATHLDEVRKSLSAASREQPT